MGKMTNMLIVLFGLQIGMILILGSDIPFSSMVEAILGLEKWTSLGFWDYFSSTLLVAGATGIAVALWTKSEMFYFLGITSVFFSFGATWYQAYTKLKAEGFLGSGDAYMIGSTDASGVILLLFLGVLVIMWFMALIEFLRGRD